MEEYKYLTIVEWAKKYIATEQLKPNDRFLTEKELCSIHNVSRQTVRQALMRLESENIISRVRGSGTFVKGGVAAVQNVVNDFEARSDIGTDATDANGSCYVYLSQELTTLLGAAGTYCVFLQEEGPGKLYVSQKTNSYFLVEGTESLNFAWELKILTSASSNGGGE